MASTVIYYINLDHRTDRRRHIEQQLHSIGLVGQRIPAIYDRTRGILGCGKSHILAVETFLKSGATYGIILEDDFTFADNLEMNRQMFREFFKANIDWDVVMLAGNVLKDEEGPLPILRKVLDAQTTSGYMITRKFAPILLENLHHGVGHLERHYAQTGLKKHEYCLDIFWKQLQPQNKWYIFAPKLGYQVESYSDIEKKRTNYRL
jgi:GR25 family glycosyltransferase involved in LPS biosynthesis